MRVLGIDPGKTGALALYQPQYSAESGMRWIIEDMPEPKLFRDFLRRWEPEVAWFEQTWHGGFANAGYQLGMAAGKALGVLACCDTRVEMVYPVTWKAYFKISKDKEQSLTLARLYVKEHYAARLARKMDHNRAEAVLLAVYGACRLV